MQVKDRVVFMNKRRKKIKVKNLFFTILTVFLIFFCIFMLYKIFSTLKDKNTKKEDKKAVVEKKKKKAKVGEAPEIKLYGIENTKMVKNGVYEEYGASAIDKEDGDISKNIKIDNKIDNKKPGDYIVTYTVTDKDGNKAKAERKVNVFEVKDKDTDGISVFMYHYFYDDTAGESGETSNYLAKSLFEGQLKYLSENDYYIPNMKEVNLYVEGKLDLPEKSAVLTLDDGEVSNYTIAYPLAVQYKIPLVWFVVTSWTDVSQDVQREMYNSGYTRYHSHTDNMHEGGCGEQHGGRILCVDHDTGVQDLKTSAEKLGNSDALAYPCGDTNDHAKAIVKEAGISLAFTTQPGQIHVGDEKLALSRVRINDGIGLDTFISQLK